MDLQTKGRRMSGLEIYILTDENYVPGVVALVNSLRRCGFDGPIHIGSPASLSISAGRAPAVHFHVLGKSPFSPMHRKAELLLAHPSEQFAYFDADVLLMKPDFMPRLATWIENAFVCSFEAIMPRTDYRRFGWARRLGLAPKPARWPDHYFNAGFFAGAIDRDRQLLEAYDQATKRLITPPGTFYADPDLPLLDQDVLNGLLQDRADEVWGVGPPDVWYASSSLNPFICVSSFGGPALLHCTGPSKPWNLATAPDHLPNIYERNWFDLAVENANPLALSLSMPKDVAAWLANTRVARFAARSRWLRNRLI
jgi:hypothetical protein